ncbi:MAG: T9SS type A sorting domain-containing protein [Saprospiraceae bacterium]
MKPFFFEQSARLLLTILFPIFFLQIANASKITKQSGNWNAPSTWEGNVVPDDTEGIVIQAGHTVTRNNGFSSYGFYIVYGTLVYTGIGNRYFFDNIANDGTIRIEGGTTIVYSPVTGTGTIRQTGGTTTYWDLYSMNLTDIQGGQVNFNNSENEIIETNYLNLVNARLKISPAPAFHVQESMTWNHNGALLTGSEIEIEASAELTFYGANSKQFNDGTILNYGTILSSNGDIDRWSETGNIYNYGLWKFDVPANSATFIQHQNVVNYGGEIEKTGAGYVSFYTDGTFHDYGLCSVIVKQGAIHISTPSQGHELNGHWQVDAGATLSINSSDADKFVPINTYKFINKGTVYGGVNFLGGGTTILEGNGKYERLGVSGAGTEVKLNGSTEVTKEFRMYGGHIILYSHDLRLGTSSLIVTGNYDSYIVTNGLGSLVRTCPIGASVFFPVGNDDFAQLVIKLSAGSTQDQVRVRVKDTFFTEYNGITPACTEEIPVGVVAHTWFVSEETAGGTIAELWPHWKTTSERSGFDRDNCTLGHYVNGDWQANGFGVAFQGGPVNYLQRDNITSFGLFSVYDAGHEPDVNFTLPTPTANSPLCEWSDLQLHANTSADVQWTGPNGFQSTLENPTIPGIQQSQGGVYTLNGSQYGCPAQNQNVNVQVVAEPTASIVGPSEIQPGESATLTANGGTSYLWNTGETEQSITVWPTQTTAYQVTVSNIPGCNDNAHHTVQVLDVSATDEAASNFGAMKIAPNPTTDATMLTFESSIAGEAQLSITDARGAQMRKEQVAIANGANQISISLADYQTGVYQLTLIAQSEAKTIRIVKLKSE